MKTIPLIFLLLPSLAFGQASLTIGTITPNVTVSGSFKHVTLNVPFTITAQTAMVKEAHEFMTFSPKLESVRAFTDTQKKTACSAAAVLAAGSLGIPARSSHSEKVVVTPDNMVADWKPVMLVACVAYQGADGVKHTIFKRFFVEAASNPNGTVTLTIRKKESEND